MKADNCVYVVHIIRVDDTAELVDYASGHFAAKKRFLTMFEARSYVKAFSVVNPLKAGNKYVVSLSHEYVSNLEDF